MLKHKLNTEPQIISKMKAHLGHIFDVDDAGNLTLKTIVSVPQFKMIFVKGNDFMIGEGKGYSDPPHPIKIKYNYFIGEFPVTQELYRAVTGKNTSRFQGVNHPVDSVNWKEAVEFCNLLNEKIGLNSTCNDNYELLDNTSTVTNELKKVNGFRLPTGVEREYAAMGGASTISAPIQGAEIVEAADSNYSGSNLLDEVGWYRENNSYETKPVGLKFPNKLGIYDMSGNVSEWCLDWYDEDFCKKNPKPIYVDISYRGTGQHRNMFFTLPGGSSIISAVYGKMVARDGGGPGGSYIGGFRLVFTYQLS